VLFYFWANQFFLNLMQTTQLNHVALHVKDVPVSGRFYEKVLRLSTIPRPDFPFPGAWYRLGDDQELHLIGGREEPVVANSRGTHFALAVTSIQEAAAHLDELSVPYEGIRTRPDGAFQIYIQDPDGHVIELTELPG
jgi:catechol 2,3-dioxygenase-like lactoylglutathione lyase family enzyme